MKLVEMVAREIAKKSIRFDDSFNGKEKYERYIDIVWETFVPGAKSAIECVNKARKKISPKARVNHEV